VCRRGRPRTCEGRPTEQDGNRRRTTRAAAPFRGTTAATLPLPGLAETLRARKDLWHITDDNRATELKRRHPWLSSP
jgi:hypothetical protein